LLTLGVAASYLEPAVGHPVIVSLKAQEEDCSRYEPVSPTQSSGLPIEPESAWMWPNDCITSSKKLLVALPISWPCQYEKPLQSLSISSVSSVSLINVERIGLQNINTAFDQRISSSILIFVPAVRGPDLELRNCFFNVLNLCQQRLPCEVATV
jgi:hypothetical protein